VTRRPGKLWCCPADDEGVRWEETALVRVLQLTRGYPYFLQEFGQPAWNVADGPHTSTLDDVDQSVPVATATLDDGFFRVRTGRTNNPERAYLRAVAELGPGPVRSGDVAALLKKRSTALGPVRDAALGRDRLHRPRVRRIHEALDPGSPIARVGRGPRGHRTSF
jgi:hypothetical protein